MDDKHPFLKSLLFSASSMTRLLLPLNPFTTLYNRVLAQANSVPKQRTAEKQEPRWVSAQ